MKKQTAVEWLLSQYVMRKGFFTKHDVEQAKEMEKEQIEDAFREGMLHHTSGLFANEYFDKTFKSEEDETDGQND
jgi:hypothetical protein